MKQEKYTHMYINFQGTEMKQLSVMLSFKCVWIVGQMTVG